MPLWETLALMGFSILSRTAPAVASPNGSLLNMKKAFDKYVYILKQELGTGLKRNIRYDDANRCLVMDIKYPGAKDEWERITFAQAEHGIAMTDSPA